MSHSGLMKPETPYECACRVDIGKTFSVRLRGILPTADIGEKYSCSRHILDFSTSLLNDILYNFEAAFRLPVNITGGSHRPVGSHRGRSAYRNKVSDSRSA